MLNLRTSLHNFIDFSSTKRYELNHYYGELNSPFSNNLRSIVISIEGKKGIIIYDVLYVVQQ